MPDRDTRSGWLHVLVEPEAEHQVDNNVLHPDHRGGKAREHLQLRVDEQRGDALDVLACQGFRAAHDAVEKAFRRQEAADRAEETVVGDRVGVLMRVRHARKEL